MNSIPKGAAGIALLLLSAARTGRPAIERRGGPSLRRSVLSRQTVGRIASSRPAARAAEAGERNA